MDNNNSEKNDVKKNSLEPKKMSKKKAILISTSVVLACLICFISFLFF